jgi:hypothetical protein
MDSGQASVALQGIECFTLRCRATGLQVTSILRFGAAASHASSWQLMASGPRAAISGAAARTVICRALGLQRIGISRTGCAVSNAIPRATRPSADAPPSRRTRLRKAPLQRTVEKLTQRALDDAGDLATRILMTQQLTQLLELIMRFLPQRELELESSRTERSNQRACRRGLQNKWRGRPYGQRLRQGCRRSASVRRTAAVGSFGGKDVAAAVSGCCEQSVSAISGSVRGSSAISGCIDSCTAHLRLNRATSLLAQGPTRCDSRRSTRLRQLPHPFWNVGLGRKLSHQHLELTLTHATGTIEQSDMILLCKQRSQKLDSSQMQTTISKPLQHQRQTLPSLSRQQTQISLRLRQPKRSHAVRIHRAITTLEIQLPSLHFTKMHKQLHANRPVSLDQTLQPREQLTISHATNVIQRVCHAQPPCNSALNLHNTRISEPHSAAPSGENSTLHVKNQIRPQRTPRTPQQAATALDSQSSRLTPNAAANLVKHNQLANNLMLYYICIASSERPSPGKCRS